MHLGKAEREAKAAMMASVSGGVGVKARTLQLPVYWSGHFVICLCEPHKLDRDFSEMEHMSIVWLAFLGDPELSSPPFLISPTITITICQEHSRPRYKIKPPPQERQRKVCVVGTNCSQVGKLHPQRSRLTGCAGTKLLKWAGPIPGRVGRVTKGVLALHTNQTVSKNGSVL